MYEMGPEARAELGQKSMLHAHRDYDLPTVIKQWDETLMNCIENWRTTHKRWEIAEI